MLCTVLCTDTGPQFARREYENCIACLGLGLELSGPSTQLPKFTSEPVARHETAVWGEVHLTAYPQPVFPTSAASCLPLPPALLQFLEEG